MDKQIYIVLNNESNILEPAFPSEANALAAIMFSYNRYEDIKIVDCRSTTNCRIVKACSDSGKFEHTYFIRKIRVTDCIEHL